MVLTIVTLQLMTGILLTTAVINQEKVYMLTEIVHGTVVCKAYVFIYSMYVKSIDCYNGKGV